MDHNVPRAIALALRLRDVDVLTAVEDGSYELFDPDLVDRASALGRALFTRDDDLLVPGDRGKAYIFRGSSLRTGSCFCLSEPRINGWMIA